MMRLLSPCPTYIAKTGANLYYYRGYNVSGFGGHFFCFRIIKFVCINVVMCDLVHDVENVHGICKLLTSSKNLF